MSLIMEVKKMNLYSGLKIAYLIGLFVRLFIAMTTGVHHHHPPGRVPGDDVVAECQKVPGGRGDGDRLHGAPGQSRAAHTEEHLRPRHHLLSLSADGVN